MARILSHASARRVSGAAAETAISWRNVAAVAESETLSTRCDLNARSLFDI